MSGAGGGTAQTFGGAGGTAEADPTWCDDIAACNGREGCRASFVHLCGDVRYGGYNCGPDDNLAAGFLFDDGTHFDCTTAEDCIDASGRAANYCGALSFPGSGGSGGAGNAGSGGAGQAGGGGSPEPEPDVIWHYEYNPPLNHLGAIATESSHQAHLGLNINVEDFYCSMRLYSPVYATGYQGSTEIPLGAEDRECLRFSGYCETQVMLRWRSCSGAGCTPLKPGASEDTYRPACGDSVDLSGNFSLIHTVHALGPDGLNETWELVAAH
jgi:hypothetical protein